jgi:serine/threonine-protein kinase
LRFRVLRPHARGGLGEVFVASDEELQREVALKEIRASHADDPRSRARFLLEARVTGGLEHPGVVPVYGLGTYPDGRPFYAMRFIKGDSFQFAIQQFHKAGGTRHDSGERALALRGLLGRFVAVCNAVAYAHSRGVLHRDLKPANVMLGAYGETLVVDWGLAKVVGRPGVDEGSTEQTLRPPAADGSAPTRVGFAIGTPGFMSPEQAAGKVDELGPASDVYSLGATLYCLLTGKAPIEGRDVGEVLQQAKQGKFAPPRQVKQEVPAALEAVCLKAMALKPEGRYPSARDLAGDVERWLADEPVSAWREPLRLRAGRWARRHQTGVAACVAGLLVALLAGGAAAWWLDRQRGEQRQAVETALVEVGRLQEQARWSEARTVLQQARQRLGDSRPQDLAVRLEQAAGELAPVDRLGDIRLRKATLAEGRLDPAGTDQEYEEAFAAAGLGGVGGDVAAAAAWVRDPSVRAALVEALDDWASAARGLERRAWVLEVARRADPDEWRDGVRDPRVWDDAALMARRVSGPQAAEQSPQLLVALGRRLKGKAAEELLRGAQQRHPADFWVNFELGNAMRAAKKPAEAVGFYRAALALRPRTVAVHNNLGLALRDQHRVEEAAAEFRRALEIDPQSVLCHANLGLVLYDQHKLEESVAAYRRALDLNSRHSLGHNGLGVALAAQHKVEEALAEFRIAMDLDPQDARPHFNIGNTLYAQGKVAEAAAKFRRALDLDPEYALAHGGLGNTLYLQGKTAEAIAAFRREIDLDPTSALAHSNLGVALREQGKLAEAIAAYRRAVEFDPNNAPAHGALGQALLDQGEFAEAQRSTQRALALLPANHPLRALVGGQLRQCEEMLALDSKLAAILRGEARPADAAEQVALAGLCVVKKRYAAAAHFYADAITDRPPPGDKLPGGDRYNAACAVALAAAGAGLDAVPLGDKEREHLRRQALGWLRADLLVWGKQADTGMPQTRPIVQKTLAHWKEDTDLAGVRDPAALAKLPEAERGGWQKLWADVEAALKKAAAPDKK